MAILLQLPAEGLVQQRLLQRVERDELLLVEGFEALGFGSKVIEDAPCDPQTLS
jgi:hypothetical protein